MSEVWKYPLPYPMSGDNFGISMPARAQVLTLQVQHERPCIWALVDPAAQRETRHFRIAGTGHPIDELIGQYVGTFQVFGGDLIFHVFEVFP